MKTVVVLGSGGREHALGWKLSRSKKVARLIVAPGNAGMSTAWERWPTSLTGKDEYKKLAARCVSERVDLVVVGPDNPLAEGVADVLREAGILVFGPSAAAAQIEASKAFAKDVMAAAQVPTARFQVAHDLVAADRALKEIADPRSGAVVVKADGLALGKGVRVCGNWEESRQAVKDLLPVSGQLVIEERLSGQEISWLGLCAGDAVSLFEPARDHKRLRDGDEGPNTGGMGAFSPVPGVPPEWFSRIRREVFQPVLKEMKQRGCEFNGVLYAGLMVDFERDRFWVLEFNARFGDPETQVILPRIDGDFYDWCEAVAQGEAHLAKRPERVPMVKDSAVVIVLAAEGYPDSPKKGDVIQVPAVSGDAEYPSYFFAGVSGNKNSPLATSGGRVLGAMGYGSTLRAACEKAYAGVQGVKFAGMQYRKDIGRTSA